MNKELFDQDRKKGLRPGVSVCILDKQNRVLLGLKKKYNVWEIPQGGLEEQDKTLDHAVRREIREELGDNFSKALFIPEECLLGTDQIVFPQKGLSGERLKVGDKEFEMIGKKYYFCAVALAQPTEPEKIEYQEFKWVDFNEGMKIVNAIRQKGKKRILTNIFKILQENEFIK